MSSSWFRWVARTRAFLFFQSPPATPRWPLSDGERVDRLAGVMNRRLRFPPPKHRLAQRSGSRMRLISVLSGANTATPSRLQPPEKPAHTLPSVNAADAVCEAGRGVEEQPAVIALPPPCRRHAWSGCRPACRRRRADLPGEKQSPAGPLHVADRDAERPSRIELVDAVRYLLQTPLNDIAAVMPAPCR
jgi:hypothetical protein